MADTPDRSVLEGALRAAESRFHAMRFEAQQGNTEAESLMQKAEADMAEVQKMLDEFDAQTVEKDYAGTPPTLADTAGNFAATPQVANVGGTGVESSNTAEGGEPAQEPAEVDLSGAIEPQVAATAFTPEIADETRAALVEQGEIEEGDGEVIPDADEVSYAEGAKQATEQAEAAKPRRGRNKAE